MDARCFPIDSKDIMKNLNQYIQEKYLIDQDVDDKKLFDPNVRRKIDQKDQKTFENVAYTIGLWLSKKDTFENYGRNNRIEFLRYIDYNLLELIDYYKGTFEEFTKELNMNNEELSDFIVKYNNEIIAKAKIMYYDLYDEIAF